MVDVVTSRPSQFRVVRRFAVLALVLIGGGYGVRAQEPSGWVELLFDRSRIESERVGGQPTVLEASTFRQRYNLDFDWQLYPNFRLAIGGLFEQDDARTRTDGLLNDATRRRWRPYLSLRQRTPLFSASFDAIRLEDTARAGEVSFGEVLDTYSAEVGWRPERYPQLLLRFQRRDNHDPSRETLNALDDLAEIRAEYLAWDKLRAYYRGTLEQLENKVDGNGVRRRSHVGQLTYADSLWHRRIQLSAEYNVNYQQQELTTSGVGEIANPIDPDAGLSAVSDTPANVVLDPNAALVDEDRLTPAGIDLGVPPPGGDDRPRNIGLDFGSPTTVNTFRLWVDQDLPVGIANTFIWEVYTSEDNLNWVQRQTIAPASFGLLEPRFEIRFNDVSARYVKVVTLPLQPTVPGADQFPSILVTELEAFLRVPAGEAPDRTDRTTQRLTSDLRVRLLEDHSFFYEFSYATRGAENLTDLWSLYNGLSFTGQLNPALRLSARAGREDNAQIDERLASWIYSASLRAVVVPTLQQTLVFSGRSNESEAGADYTNSVYLNNSLAIYRGIKADVGLGSAASKRPDGERLATQQVNAKASLVPHRTLTFNLQYQLRREDRRGSAVAADGTSDRTISSASVAYIPFSAIYAFASYRVEQNSRSPDRTFQDYSLSWSPFAGGGLQLTFAYNGTQRSDLDTTFRIFTTRARWNITYRWWVEIAWQKSTTDSLLVREASDILRASTRFVF